MGDGAYLLLHRFGVLVDALGFVGDDKAFLQPLVVGRDACWARVFVTLQRLNAAEREHETPRRDDEIGAGAQRPRHFPRGDQLATGHDEYAFS